MIREATKEDIPGMVALGELFYPHTSYVQIAPFCPDSCAALGELLLAIGTLIVAEEDGLIVGMVGGLVTPLMWNVSVSGFSEVIFFVHPSAQSRGIGNDLLVAMDQWCERNGMRYSQMHKMTNSPPQLEQMYLENGHPLTESSYTKVY